MQSPPLPTHPPASGEVLHVQLAVDAALPCFAGHFPGQPLVPAALQIDWMLRLLTGALGGDVQVVELRLAKFLRPITPGTEVELRLWPVPGGVYQGEITSPAGLHSKFSFAPPKNESACCHSQLQHGSPAC